jgi:dipeptidyl aminopeptidase/acylaminoacyl peptidase
MDYLDWQSELSLAQVFGAVASFSYASMLDDFGVLYLSKSKQDNRSVLMLANGDHKTCITPAPFNLQTRVNEYGGKPYWVHGSSLVFCNQADQCLYRQKISQSGVSSPKRISVMPTNEKRFMYTDLHELEGGAYLSIVELESATTSHANNAMYIALLNQDAEGELGEPIEIVNGADFYSNLVVDPTKTKVAWVQWNHPNMPWDDTELWTAEIHKVGQSITFENRKKIDVSNQNNGGASICQLIFSNNNRLFFSADYSSSSDVDVHSVNGSRSENASNYWNVHVYDFVQEATLPVTFEQREYGYPHWVYGDHRIVQLSDTKLLTIASAPTGDELILIDQTSLECQSLLSKQPACTFQHLSSDGNGTCVVSRLPFDSPPSLVKLNWADSTANTSGHTDLYAVVEAAPVHIEISNAQEISFNTRDGSQAYGFYYPPINSSQYKLTDANARPPLLVMVHGGPTARAYGHFDLQKQFWTSRGFAILDVNHRGSTGYGRTFRDALYGEWGELDASDIVDGVAYLIEQQRVDPERICIRGKSAGGYAVLRALTEYPELFRVGACYYGIGNLITLSETTHKFEKHYTDRLIDEVFDPAISLETDSKFYQRSPINKMAGLNSAMIVFQGGQDRVVPPSVAQEIIKVLVKSGIDHEYVEYSGEGHGFKKIENNIDAWHKELKFYQQVLRRKTKDQSNV